MKVGDLVVAKDSNWAPDPDLTSIKYLNECKEAGVVLKVLNDDSHRKQNNYEVYWAGIGKTSWHAKSELRLI